MKSKVSLMFLALNLFLAACQAENNSSDSSSNTGDTVQKEKENNHTDSSQENDKTDNTEENKDAGMDIFKVAEDSSIDHVHGIGYAGGDEGLFLATHNGLMIYRDEKWYEQTEEKHDYMGFSATDNGFYSSGHPAEGSDLKNPLGLIKSTDKGKSFEKLGFYGESDFHYMAVGYNSHAIYIVNQKGNSKLKPGVYFSNDDGENWKEVGFGGLPDKVGGIVAHPDKEEVVAVTSPDGVFLSTNKGNEFKKIEGSVGASAATMTENEVVYAEAATQPDIIKQPVEGGEKTTIKGPDLVEDGILYIAVNPNKEDELAVFTMNNSIYLTKDNGENWKGLASKGKIK
ncbi:F510_1955 family glycosylhydrolase [Pseudalkalibacillus caeni]|uniref:Sortilin N-terminal domain-containing protein n=1 Tax=Exobacillus caeni TaxID=2574798 RepID=A0A5R9F6M7_9BACL|nr:hypothetical protein [Pseudalkalibacillus caeni]TLS35435.1 hypothetical protein FCL54_20270 [Pseudalkalibacillus caeni]